MSFYRFRLKNIPFELMLIQGSFELPLRLNLAKIGEIKKTKGISGYVYLLSSNGSHFGHKIGKSQNPSSRAETLSKQIKIGLDLIHSFPADDYTKAENELQRQFAAKLINGEWFDLAPSDVDYIKSIASYEAGEFRVSEVME